MKCECVLQLRSAQDGGGEEGEGEAVVVEMMGDEAAERREREDSGDETSRCRFSLKNDAV
jgi:hypothetical protein